MTIDIHRWAEDGTGSVNTYWIETADAIVVIDGQRTLSAARRVRAEIEASGKPIVAVFLTHPHPDHFGGLGVFAPAGSGIPIVASRRTRDSMAEDRAGFVRASRELLGDDFPAKVSLPDRLVEDGERLLLAGLEWIVHELGEGEAECMTALGLPAARALFCGDAIQDRMTAFLLEGRLDAWVAQLRLPARRFDAVDRVYPGHGAPGPSDALFARQLEYLESFRSIVARFGGDATSSDATARIVAEMEARYPGYLPVAAIPDLLARNVEPVAQAIAATPRR